MMKDRKEDWITALHKEVANEIQKAKDTGEWPDFRTAWSNANEAVGLRMTQ
jgi:hypothetical protein